MYWLGQGERKNAARKKLLFFLEIDRGTEAPSVVLDKIAGYCSYCDSGNYKKYRAIFDHDFNGFRLLLLANNEKRRTSLLNYIESTGMRNIDFVWVSHSEIVDEDLLTEPIWRIPHREDAMRIMTDEKKTRGGDRGEDRAYPSRIAKGPGNRSDGDKGKG